MTVPVFTWGVTNAWCSIFGQAQLHCRKEMKSELSSGHSHGKTHGEIGANDLLNAILSIQKLYRICTNVYGTKVLSSFIYN